MSPPHRTDGGQYIPRFQHIAYIVLISSLLFGHTPAGNSQEKIPVTYRAEFKPFGGGFTWSQAIPPDGGALGLELALVLSSGTVTAEVAGEILLYKGSRTVRIQGSDGHLSSDGGIVLKGDIVMDFIIPLPEAFFEEDDEPHIKSRVPIPGLNIDKGWNESVQFDSFLLSGDSVKLDIGIPELVTLELSAVKIIPVVAATILSGGTATAAAKIFAESLSDYLDAGIRLNGGMVSELTLAGKAVTVNGTPVTREGVPIHAPGLDPTVETYQLESGYDEDFTYTLDFVASGSAYARVAVLFGIEIWSYDNRFAEERVSIIPASSFDLNFGGAATSAMIDVPPTYTPPGTHTLLGPGDGVIRDGWLASAIRHTLRGTSSEIPWDEPITRNHLLRLTRLDNPWGVRSLIGLEHAVNLRYLDLKNNYSLSDVSPLSGLPNLTDLNLSNCAISDVSPLSGLTNLRELHLGSNAISKLSLSNLPSLTELSFGGNPLSELSLSGLTSLTKLDLYKKAISKLSLSNLPSLTGLNLSNNAISSAVSLSNLPSLTGLNLGGNILPEVSLSGLTSLTKLVLGGNVISKLSLSGLTSLTGLDLRGDALSELSLSNLPSLTRMNLNRNTLSAVSLSNLPNLTFLSLPGNALSELSLSNLPSLTSLGLESSTISDVSPLVGLTSLTHLYLNRNAISDVSPLSGLTNLKTLSLYNNAISDVSPLSGLTNLTSLGLGSNSILDASPLAKLTNLETLDLHNNALSVVSLSNLPSLTYLYLWGNPLSSVSLSGLTSLTELNLGANPSLSSVSLSGLTSLTELSLWRNPSLSSVSLSDLTNLKTLNLPGNAISDVSPLSGLTSLTELYLSDNSISDVFPLSGLTSLTELYLSGNPLNSASHTHIFAMRVRGVNVLFDGLGAYPTLVKISGEGQTGAPGAVLTTPLVVQALGVEDKPISGKSIGPVSGVSIKFVVYQGGGMLSTTTTTTDATGKAQTTLTLGPNPGTNRVAVIADGFEAGVSFIATAREPEQIVEDPNGDSPPPEQIAGDANGDGVVDILDLTLVGSSFGQQGATAADVNGDGVVNIRDLVLVSGAISNAAAAPAAGSMGEQ